jgi:small subunit ribosomal protein S30
MLLLRLKTLPKNIPSSRRLTTAFQQKNADEYSEVAEYPEIKERSIPILQANKQKVWHEKIQKIETIEEKLIEINLPKYYGYKCLMLDNKTFPYNTLPFFKYVTKTEFVEAESHVPKTEEEAKKIENCLNVVRSEVLDAFEFELDGYQ